MVVQSLLETCLVAAPGMDTSGSLPSEIQVEVFPFNTVLDSAVFPPILADDGQPQYEFSEYYNSYVPSKLMSKMPDMSHQKKLSEIFSCSRGEEDERETKGNLNQVCVELLQVAELCCLPVLADCAFCQESLQQQTTQNCGTSMFASPSSQLGDFLSFSKSEVVLSTVPPLVRTSSLPSLQSNLISHQPSQLPQSLSLPGCPCEDWMTSSPLPPTSPLSCPVLEAPLTLCLPQSLPWCVSTHLETLPPQPHLSLLLNQFPASQETPPSLPSQHLLSPLVTLQPTVVSSPVEASDCKENGCEPASGCSGVCSEAALSHCASRDEPESLGDGLATEQVR